MTDINNSNNGLWEITNQQNIQQNEIQQQEIMSVFQDYLDNPDIVLGLSRDQRTPPDLMIQIAFQTMHIESRNNAIRVIMNAEWNRYTEDVFRRIMQIREAENATVIGSLHEYKHTLWYIIATWSYTPYWIYERMSLHSNNPEIQDVAIRRLVNDVSHQYNQDIYQDILRIVQKRLQEETESNTRNVYAGSYDSLSIILSWAECVPLHILQEVADLANTSKIRIQRKAIFQCLMDNERNPYITREFLQCIRKKLNKMQSEYDTNRPDYSWVSRSGNAYGRWK